MSLYMILLYGSLALGQLLLKQVDPMVLTPFALCAMAATLSVVPLALSRVATPAMVSSIADIVPVLVIGALNWNTT